jgi:hypothetical protein
MLPTDEPPNPGIEFSNYWADNVELRFGSGLMNFVLRVTQPGSFKVRLRVGSEKLYESEYVADFEVTVRCGASADRRLLLPLALPLGTSEAPPSGLRQRKGPRLRAFPMERMMGLEPTTFCMASRRSSQLSYIRAAQRL